MEETPGTPIRIRPYRDDDEQPVVQLLGRVFGTYPESILGEDPTEFFRWKHRANPFGRSLMMVAEDGDVRVGFTAWLRWRVRAHDETIEVLRGVDAGVDREYRGQGILGALVREGTKHFPADAAFTLSTPNALSRPGTIRAGGHQLGLFPLILRVRRPIRIARELLRRSTAEGVEIERPAPAVETVSSLLREAGAIGRLLSRAEQPTACFGTAIDLGYLRWRYGTIGDYRSICERRGGELVGMVIFRVRRRRTSVESAVCELFVAPGDRRVARRLLRRVVRAASVDHVACQFPPRSTARLAAIQCGFLPVPFGSVALTRPLTRHINPDPTERRSWALSMGDLEDTL